jgi:hypothetical protein
MNRKANEPLVSTQAIEYVKSHIKEIIEHFADLTLHTPDPAKPVAIFMAGSPGAGKTEFSKSLIKNIGNKESLIDRWINNTGQPVRIDADDIRALLPQYCGNNSDAVQGACGVGVDKLLDHVFKYDQNFILDGTMVDYGIARRNIERAIKHRRVIEIFYVYQDPLRAWEFTKAREIKEGRTVPREVFLNAFFAAQDTVNRIKAEFGSQIKVHLIIKDYKNDVEKMNFNIERIDSYLKGVYHRERLEEIIK